MSSIIWKEDSVFIHNGINILSKNPISYDYFSDQFAHTIDFLNNATVTYNYEDNPDQRDMLYSVYSDFIYTYKSKLQLSDEQTVLKKDDKSVTVSIVLILIEHLKWKMSVNTDIIKPTDRYTDDGHREYLKQYFENQKKVYDMQLQYLTRNVVEQFTFHDPEVVRILKSQMDEKQGIDSFDLIVGAVRMIKNDPKKFEDYKDFLFDIDIDTIDYSLKLQPTNLWAYILFNMIFLEQRYAIFCAGESIKTSDGVASERLLIDKATMIELYDYANSGTIIMCSIPFNTFNNFMTDKQSFEGLKKDIKASYDDLYAATTSLQEKLKKVTQHMEKQIQEYGKIEFYVGTKGKDVSFVQDIVTQRDPKKYYETQEKLYGGSTGGRDIHEKGGTKVFKKKRDIGTL